MQQLYTTEYLLERLYSELESKVQKKKFTMKKPQVSTINRKTYIKNFEELYQNLRCDELHLKNFLKKELNTELSVNESNILMLDTMRSAPLVENAFAKYAKNFVICLEPKCGSGDTEIIKENRILYLCCKSCNSKKSIDDIY
jgi:translation initiation factor 2 subunit 2